MRYNIEKKYFEWMIDRVCRSEREKAEYSYLLHLLDNIDFHYVHPMDSNRLEDGIAMRYRFGDECDIPQYKITESLDYKQCSVLEMMVALCVRCEEHIMANDDFGDRTGHWFWSMIASLGLSKMTNDHFNEYKAKDIIYSFLLRTYSPDGEGGLVTIKNCKYDLREEEIWVQVMWYLNRFEE